MEGDERDDEMRRIELFLETNKYSFVEEEGRKAKKGGGENKVEVSGG
jgi:hypothetical protein